MVLAVSSIWVLVLVKAVVFNIAFENSLVTFSKVIFLPWNSNILIMPSEQAATKTNFFVKLKSWSHIWRLRYLVSVSSIKSCDFHVFCLLGKSKKKYSIWGNIRSSKSCSYSDFMIFFLLQKNITAEQFHVNQQ